jgi:hypothetical protein
MKETFWYFNPGVLFAKDAWYRFVPTANMSVPEALNAVVRFSVYLSVLLFMTSMDPLYLLLVPLVMATTVVLHMIFPKAKRMTESFVSSYIGEERSQPTPDNPFMNASLVDIRDNPRRPPADDVTKIDVREKVNDSFAQTSNIYMDTTDVFDLVQAQRNFHTVPEDDHAGLLAFLRGEDKSGKRLSEGYVVAKGTMAEMPSASVATQPRGTSPSPGGR